MKKFIEIWKLEGFTDDNGRLIKVIFSPKMQGIRNLAISQVVAPPGSRGTMHIHEESDEFWYILGGRGEIIIGDEKISVEPDMVIYGPASVPHQLINTGQDPLKAIFILHHQAQKSRS